METIKEVRSLQYISLLLAQKYEFCSIIFSEDCCWNRLACCILFSLGKFSADWYLACFISNVAVMLLYMLRDLILFHCVECCDAFITSTFLFSVFQYFSLHERGFSLTQQALYLTNYRLDVSKGGNIATSVLSLFPLFVVTTAFYFFSKILCWLWCLLRKKGKGVLQKGPGLETTFSAYYPSG